MRSFARGRAVAADSFEPAVREALGTLGGTSRWLLEQPSAAPRTWLLARPTRTPLREQGWKLHVSAGVGSAAVVLDRALPILIADEVAFKVASSPRVLSALNGGGAGLSQVGKFLTVYPRDDAQAVALAPSLDEATAGLAGPEIRSDRPLRPGSLVHYRYGAFRGETVQEATGETRPALRAPSGELVPDLRRTTYVTPDWVEDPDPFLRARVTTPSPERSPVVAERYLLVGRLHESARGSVFLGVDLRAARRCVLKQAPRRPQVGAPGHEPAERLALEWRVLRRLAPDGRFPAPYALVPYGADLFLVMEEIVGTTLEEHVRPLAVLGRTVSFTRLVDWGLQLAGLLDRLHSRGLVCRDLKSANVLVTDTGGLRLVDFDLTCPIGVPTIPGTGTRGYRSPQQDAGEPAAVADDVHALGALLAYAATGAEPSRAPDSSTLLARPLALLNPTIAPDIADLIARCLAPDPASRPQGTDEIRGALLAARARAAAGPRRPSRLKRAAEAELRARPRRLARRLADALCANACRPGSAPGLTWLSDHPVARGAAARDVNAGAAGIALALAECVDEFRDPADAEVLRQAVSWLAASAPPGPGLAGLYVGESGVVAAMLRAGVVLDDAALVSEAGRRARAIAEWPHGSPDLFHGTAGRLRLHLLAWDAAGSQSHLEDAVLAGERLVSSAEDAGGGCASWTIPAGYGRLSGQRYLGYAHGAAGIGDALLDLFEVTGERRFRDAARGAARLVARNARPALGNGSGLAWPATEGGAPAAGYWCHGGGGIGRFWQHAAALDLLPGAGALARGAVRAVARGTRWAAPPACHGLAGSIELLLDAYQLTGDRRRLADARLLADLLYAFAVERDGSLVWSSESPAVVSPDYQVGFAGVLATLLRLADPQRRPHQLSRDGFRFRASGEHR